MTPQPGGEPRPGRHRPREVHPVDGEVEPLGEEGDEAPAPGARRAAGARRSTRCRAAPGLRPGRTSTTPAPCRRTPCAGGWAPAGPRHVFAGEVVAHRQRGLEEEVTRPLSASTCPSTPSVTRRLLRRQSIRSNGSRGCPIDRLVLLVPLGERLPVQHHVAGQVGVVRSEGRRRPARRWPSGSSAACPGSCAPRTACAGPAPAARPCPGRPGARGRRPSGSTKGASSPATSSRGTAYDGTTRRGSHTSRGAAS